MLPLFLLGGVSLVGSPISSVPRDAILQSDATSTHSQPQASDRPSERQFSNSPLQLCLMKRFDFTPTGGTGCWGWEAPDGTEYGFMGVYEGIAVVNVTTLQVVDTIEGPQIGCDVYRWRDMKNYQHYLYAVSECEGLNEGLLIVDLQYLPDSLHIVGNYTTANPPTCHDFTIDTARGFAYLTNYDYSGFRVVDLSNPESPTELPVVNTGSLHDLFARNDTVWTAEANQKTFSIWNMTNILFPQRIAHVTIPSAGYVHNIWPTEDGKYVGTTEETAFKTVKFWNVENPDSIELVGEYLAPNNLAHNVHFARGRAYISHYQSGVVMLNVDDMTHPVELDRYDTHPNGENPNFSGCWGVFPHTSSGKVYASNINGQFFIFNEVIVPTGDTMFASHDTTLSPGHAQIDISLSNINPTGTITIPFSWAGPYSMLFDSISVAGLRTDGYTVTKVIEDIVSLRAVWKLVPPSGFELQAGDGLVATIHFTVPPNATGDSNIVSLDPQFGVDPQLTNSCYTIVPVTISGGVTAEQVDCCTGSIGDINQDQSVDIADLTYLIDYLFITHPALICPVAANFDSGNQAIDMVDLSRMIDIMFISTINSFPSCQ